MTEHSVNVRGLALETLLAVMEDGGQSHFVIRETLDAHPELTQQEKSFYRRLTAGTIACALQLDYILDTFSSVRTKKMKPVIREIMRMAVFQFLYMDAVPDAAAVNEAVKLTRKFGFRGLTGFVNGVLRAVSRGIGGVKYPSMAEDPVRSLEIRYSMPSYLVKKWIDEFGTETTEQICRGFMEKRPVTVRLRGPRAEELARMYHREEERRRPSENAVADGTETKAVDNGSENSASGAQVSRLENSTSGTADNGRDVRKAPYVPDAWYMENAGNLAALSEFRNGSVIVQDVSSQMAVRAAGIRPGDTILDVCAAPGGKSILAADLTGPEGHVRSCDISEKRAARIVENVKRCRLENVDVVVRDARKSDDFPANVVICDVPCTGYGDIGRKPEIRYRASEENIRELVSLQREILRASVSHVRPGGTLLFSTCTFGHRENQDSFLWLQKEFGLQPVDLTERIPAEVAALPGVRETAAQGYVQLLPGCAKCDGFFFGVLTRPEA